MELGRQAEVSEMLRQLNAILKRTLKSTTPEKVRLSQEFEIVKKAGWDALLAATRSSA